MIPFGREFQVAQFISAFITGLSSIYMLRVSMQESRWIYMTLAVHSEHLWFSEGDIRV